MTIGFLRLALLLVGIGLAVSPAHAGPVLTWSWSYLTNTTADASYSGSGTLTTNTTPDLDGNYTILEISGVWNRSASGPAVITGLSTFFGPDNKLNVAAGSLLTTHGFSFEHGFGDSVNLYAVDPNLLPGTYAAYDSDLFSDLTGVFMVEAVPEPGTAGLLALGLGLLAAARLRRAGKSLPQSAAV